MNITNPPSAQSYHQAIAAVAHELWDKDGRQPDRDLDYWLEAERQVLSKQKHDAVTATAATTKGFTSDAKRGTTPVSAGIKSMQQSPRSRESSQLSQRRVTAL